uniref:Uncharacterized protein n=1 Tax=Manihot esculenta TaxID=3983 RepID=A0A2C9V7M3_MANES
MFMCLLLYGLVVALWLLGLGSDFDLLHFVWYCATEWFQL